MSGNRSAMGAMALLRRWVLTGARRLPPAVQARWLSTLFLLYEAVVLGVVYDFAREASANPSGWRAWVPRPWLVKGHMLAYCLRSHRNGVVIDGVLRRVRTADGQPVDAVALRASLTPKAPASGRHIFPAWMLADMQALADIEPELAPTPEQLAQFYVYSTVADPAPGNVYAKLWQQVGAAGADAVVIVPWLRRGGADKGALQFMAHYRARFERVLCVMTHDSPTPWRDLAPAGVAVLDAGGDLSRLEPTDRRTVLARLLLQLQPRLVHVVQSEIGWEVMAAHGRALRTLGVALIGSLFTDEMGAGGELAGYASRYAAACRPVLDRVLSDNATYCRALVVKYGFSEQTVFPIYFWQDAPSAGTVCASSSPQFLWAGRLCAQKRPDALLAIAKAAPDIAFDVWGEVEPDSRAAARKLRRLPNVRLQGAYQSFADIVARGGHAGLVYTTAFDGMPNVLLEAAAVGLPIVAPAGIGGIGELVTESTGYPVSDAGLPAEYVAALRRILNAPAEAASRAESARQIVLTRHSREAFDRAMSAMLDGVLPRVAAPPAG